MAPRMWWPLRSRRRMCRPPPTMVMRSTHSRSMANTGLGQPLPQGSRMDRDSTLRTGHHTLNAIYFSATPESVSIEQGDLVDVAFNAQINEFRGERTVQMNVLDIRPSCCAESSPELHDYARLRSGLSPSAAALLLPDRVTLGDVWRYLAAAGPSIRENPICLCRKIVRRSGRPLSVGKMLTCLDIFADVGLLQTQRLHKYIRIDLSQTNGKADLNQSQTMQLLLRAKGG